MKNGEPWILPNEDEAHRLVSYNLFRYREALFNAGSRTGNRDTFLWTTKEKYPKERPPHATLIGFEQHQGDKTFALAEHSSGSNALHGNQNAYQPMTTDLSFLLA